MKVSRFPQIMSPYASDSGKYYMTINETLWVRIPKCASSSVQASFKQHPRELSCLSDVNFSNIKNIFVVTRNPLDRLVSCWSDRVNRATKGSHLMPESIQDQKYVGDFAAFANAVCKIPDTKADQHFRSQYTFLLGIPIWLPVIHVDLYDLSTSWSKIKNQIKPSGSSDKFLEKKISRHHSRPGGCRGHMGKNSPQPIIAMDTPRNLRSHHHPRSPKNWIQKKKDDYKLYYTDDLMKMVTDRYAIDFDLFGYEFNDGTTLK
jgi:hypothetical protein